MSCYKLEPQLYIVKDECLKKASEPKALSKWSIEALKSKHCLSDSMAVGFTMGGLGSLATGGDFWSGAATGVLVAVANHYLHQSGGGKRKAKQQIQKKTSSSIKQGVKGNNLSGKAWDFVADNLISPPMGYLSLMGELFVNGSYGVGLAFSNNMEIPRDAKPLIPMKVPQFQNGDFSTYDFNSHTTQQNESFTMKATLKGLPSVPFSALGIAPTGNVIVDTALSWGYNKFIKYGGGYLINK